MISARSPINVQSAVGAASLVSNALSNLTRQGRAIDV